MTPFAFTCALLLCLLTPALPSHAQTFAPIRIEVASVRPHKPVTGDDPSNRKVLPGGRFVASATSVHTLIRTAFGVDDKAIVNAPGWTESETFDINATTVDHAEVTTPEQFKQLMLSLLQDQFGFRFHLEQREGPVYWMELDKPGKLGPDLKESAPGTQQNISMNGDRTVVMNVSSATMADFAKSISRRAGRIVEDHTNLTGLFDSHIRWSSDPTPDSDDPSLAAALKEQLGLKLKPAKGPVKIILVENVTHPTGG